MSIMGHYCITSADSTEKSYIVFVDRSTEAAVSSDADDERNWSAIMNI